jgi:NAD(P)-dependent dehydrogenase (short-subunit alcohol dehydrogenase family)
MQQSIREFSRKFLKNESRLDVLISNAGVQIFRKACTIDGLELTMSVNYFGPFLLLHLLFPILVATGKISNPRVVIVSSKFHQISTFNPTSRIDDINPLNFWLPSHIYNNSKFCNILLTLELAKRLRKHNIQVNSVHPGTTFGTNFYRNFPTYIRVIICIFTHCFGRSPAEAAITILYLALSPRLSKTSGKYFRNCKESRPNPRVFDSKFMRILWKSSLKLTKLNPSIDPII